jgi:hypothetical protein
MPTLQKQSGSDALEEAWKKCQRIKAADVAKARLFYSNGHVATFKTNQEAYALWLAMPKGYRIAFRGIGDSTPVYSQDYADKP